MALAHNGNLTNTKQLREELINDNAVFQTTIDSEVMALLINKNSYGDIVKGVLAACNRFKGSFALVVMTADKLIAVRDPYGIRPLVMGKNLDDVVIASETCALDAVGRQLCARRQAGAKFWSSIPRASIRIFWKARAESAPPVSSNTCISRARQRSGRLQRVRIEKRGRAAARQI